MAISELLLYALFAGFILLFNLITQWLGRRRQGAEEEEIVPQQGQPQPGQEDAMAPRPAVRVEELWGRNPPELPPVLLDLTPPPPVQRPVPEVGARLATRPSALRPSRLLGSRQALRRAVVTMTILKPCRALEPFEADDGPARR